MRNLNFSVFVSRVVLLGVLAVPSWLHAQNTFTNQAGEYSIIGSLPGDQMFSDVAFNGNGGWVVWQDNASDEDGYGLSARHLNSTLSGELNVFRVNQNGAGDQQNPKVAVLKNGGAVFAWQGGVFGAQRIVARFVKPDGTFATGDLQVNTYTNREQIEPVLACLNNSNVVVAWSSYDQDGDAYGVYGRILSPSGNAVTAEFPVNQTTALSQHAPSIAALANGNFIVTWASESSQLSTQSTTFGSDTNQYDVVSSTGAGSKIYGRIFNASGASVGGEFLISGNGPICANPSVASTPDGGFLVAWSQLDNVVTNGWNVFGRAFAVGGSPLASPVMVNTYTYGDQFAPKVAANGTNCFIIWTSLGQDGADEGVYGQYMTLAGVKIGSELRVNTTTISEQLQPALGVDSSGRYLATWSSFVGGSGSFDLFAQRYATPGALPTPDAPFIAALDQGALSVTWADLAGYSVAFYEVYVDGATNPIVVNGLRTTVGGLNPGTSHSVRLLYQLTDGRRSSLSPTATGVTWGADNNHDGLPDDWEALYWGPNPANWPSPTADSDGDGVSNLMEFLAGTDPTNPNSVLKASMATANDSLNFSWNTQAGQVYQVQTSTNLRDWSDLGSARFAHGSTDSVAIGNSGQSTFYRVIRLR